MHGVANAFGADAPTAVATTPPNPWNIALFSYRHGFHAGNHADVLKHVILLATLDHFKQKDAGFWVIDTHAGAGLYDLRGEWANKKGEYLEGIARLWSANSRPLLVEHYIDAVRALNPSSDLAIYPGSPWLSLMALRPQDKLKMFELLAPEFAVLHKNLTQQRHLLPRAIQVQAIDGFAALKALLPPSSRRAVMLIDPPYENKQDYRHVVTAMKEAIKRFPTGTYLVWYPRVNRLEGQQMVRQLRQLPQEWLDVEVTVRKPPVDSHGLFGSGMFLVNPPYTLAQALKATLPWLTQTLALDATARWQMTNG